MKHYLVAYQLPLGLRGTHAVDQEVVLLFTNHRAVGLAGNSIGGVDGCGGFKVAVEQAGVQHEHVDHVAKLHAAENLGAVTGFGQANRHPFVVCALGKTLAFFPHTFCTFGVVFCAVAVGVVGRFVVVPNGDEGKALVQLLQVFIALVLGVAGAVVG